MSDDIGEPAAIIPHINPRGLARSGGVDFTNEIGIGLLDAGKLGGAFRTFNGVVAEGICLDDGIFTGLQQKRGETGITLIDIEELRLTLLHVHFVSHASGSIGLYGIEKLRRTDIELVDGEAGLGGFGHAHSDLSLGRARSK